MGRLFDIVQSAEPSATVHFRASAYGAAGITEFLRDVIALANAADDGPRYLVVGVELLAGGRRRYHDVPRADFGGNPAYVGLVAEFVEPAVRLRHEMLAIDGRHVGVFEIDGCHDRPYMMRIDHSPALRRGDAWMQVNRLPVKLGRSQLQGLFESRFRDAMTADRVEVGFPGEIIHKDLELATISLNQLPSRLARSKLQQLVDILMKSRGVSLASTIGRLTHARLFGSDSEFKDKTADELLSEMSQTGDRYYDADQYFLFETHASRVQIVVLNQGSEALQGASLTLALPFLDGFHVADCLPKVPRDDGFVERSSLQQESYPLIARTRDGIRVSLQLGDIAAGAPAMAFESPLRVAATDKLAGRRIGIRYSLSAANLRMPAIGKLRLLLRAA